MTNSIPQTNNQNPSVATEMTYNTPPCPTMTSALSVNHHKKHQFSHITDDFGRGRLAGGYGHRNRGKNYSHCVDTPMGRGGGLGPESPVDQLITPQRLATISDHMEVDNIATNPPTITPNKTEIDLESIVYMRQQIQVLSCKPRILHPQPLQLNSGSMLKKVMQNFQVYH